MGIFFWLRNDMACVTLVDDEKGCHGVDVIEDKPAVYLLAVVKYVLK